jgi:hypothetical protein
MVSNLVLRSKTVVYNGDSCEQDAQMVYIHEQYFAQPFSSF